MSTNAGQRSGLTGIGRVVSEFATSWHARLHRRPRLAKRPSGAIAERLLANPASAQLGRLPHVLLLGGGLPIKIGNEVVGAIGAGGAPGADLDEACAKAGIDKIADRLK